MTHKSHRVFTSGRVSPCKEESLQLGSENPVGFSALTSDGSAFHRAGPATEKHRSPKDLVPALGRTRRIPCCDDRNLDWGRYTSRRSFRYSGAAPITTWCTRVHTLNVIRSHTGSQWRVLSVGVMCSNRSTDKTSLAAEFCSFCNRFIWNAGAPTNRLLP